MVEASTRETVASEVGVLETTETFDEVFNNTRLLGENAVPIPPTIGDRFNTAFDKSKQVMGPFHKDWQAAYKAYNETGSIESYDKVGYAEENFVRRVIQALYERTYMQDPTAEFSTHNPEFEQFSSDMKYIVEAAVKKSGKYGLNLRKYVQKQIIDAHLTNYGVVRLGYTPEAGSREDVIKLYNKVKEQLRASGHETVQETEHLYSLLGRLGQELETRRPMGLFLRNVSPFMLFVDTDATMDDLSDATITFELEYIKESVIKAEYMRFDSENNRYTFRYDNNVVYAPLSEQPQATAKDNKQKIEQEVLAIMSNEQREVMTKDAVLCVRIFDKVTRMEYLYVHGQWNTPLWVWEDQLELSRFFPYFLLAFSPATTGIARKSEASYYIPHQATINRENQQWETVRSSSFTTIVYDSTTIDKQEVDRLISESLSKTRGLKAIGVKLKGPEARLKDALEPFVLPIAQLGDLLNNPRSRAQVEAAMRMPPAAQGKEFKTNTTNDAIAEYNTQLETQIYAAVDIIEDNVRQIMWAISEVIVSRYPKTLVEKLVGPGRSQQFRSMTVDEFNTAFALELEAGSTEKANSTNKKRESMQIIQMLGQFGTAAPITIITIVTKLLRKAFSRTIVTDEELKTLKEEGLAAMQKGVSTPQQGQPPSQPQ